MQVMPIEGVCQLVVVFNNTGIVGESSLGMFVETWINISTLLPCT